MKKIAVVLNSKHDLPSQLNALGHSSLGLGQLASLEELALRDFRDSADQAVARMTDLSLIVFSARNGSHIREAHERAQALGLISNAFFAVMKSAFPREQELEIRKQRASEQDYISLALIGEADILRPLTKRFSLFRSQST